jgi:L,D-transpeptidase catalytic domain
MRCSRYYLRLFIAVFASIGAWEASAEDQKKQIFTWQPERSRSGPILIIVNIDAQVAFVYRNGIQIGQTPVSTGRPGYPTPTGVFSILGKDADHHSKKYDNAAMPFAERLTWSGIFLHAGDLPGYPSSHGCVHLPLAFAKDLFETTGAHDTTVVITQSTSHPTEAGPVEQLLRTVETEADASGAQAPNNVLWEPDKSKEGSVAIVVSGLDKRIEVLRGGVLIGQAPINFRGANTSLTEALYLKLQPSAGKAPADWSAVLIEGSQTIPASEVLAEIQIPAPLGAELNKLLVPGTLLITTPDSLTPDNRSATSFVGIQASGATPSP